MIYLMHCRAWALLMAAFVLLPLVGWSLDSAVLRGTCLDAATGQPAACSVAITDSTGKRVVERGAFSAGFRCPGHFSKEVAPGRTWIRVTRGFETEAAELELDLAAGAETNLTFTLQRKVDLRARGWYAGDSHAHMLHGERTLPVDFDFVALSARAEDLQYLSLAQAWALDEVLPEKLDQVLASRSTKSCLLTWNLEAPKNYYKGDAARCLGHCWTLGMRGRTREGTDVISMLLKASAWDYESEKPTFGNFESHRLIHAQGGAVFYTHPARWWTGPWGGQGGYPKVERMRVSNMAVELPLDTLLGPTYDGIDVLTTSGEREANAKAFALWAMLLNHGYRLAATASSDSCFDRPGGAVPGSARTYTFVPNGFSLSKVTRATAAGHTVATTGPLLVPLLDGKPPGSAFVADNKPHQLAIEAWAPGFAPRSLASVEVVRNGQAWRAFKTSDGAFFQTNLPLRELEDAWYCVRVVATNGAQMAISSAFYFATSKFSPPAPAAARVHVQVIDEQSGKALPAQLVEVTFGATKGIDGPSHKLKSGEGWLQIPGIARVRAEVPGYAPLTLSPVFDNPGLVRTVTTLEDADLSKWETYEKLCEQLAKVELVFRLHKRS